MTFEPGDIVSVKLFQRYLDQEIMNVLTFLVVDFGVSVDSDDIFDAIETVLIDEFRKVQHTTLNYWKVRLDNLTDLITFIEKGVDISGLIAGSALPSYVAGGFTKIVSSKLTRPGSMRLGGISEGDVDSNEWNPDSTNLAAIETALQSYIVGGTAPLTNFAFKPIVAKCTGVGPPATHVYNAVDDVIAKANISSQVSRKAGQGT